MESGLPRPSYSFLKRNRVLLKEDTDGCPQLLYTHKTPTAAIIELERFYAPVVHVFANLYRVSEENFDEALAKMFHEGTEDANNAMEVIEDKFDLDQLAEGLSETEDLLESEDDAPIIQLINALLSRAIKSKASDIHIETYEKRLVVRFRVDGVLKTILEPKRALAPLLISRIKVMSKLDIAEKRIPQDGRISLRIAGRDVDIRVSTLPSSNSERVVMRILDKQANHLNVCALGMQKDDEERLSDLLHKPHGILLVTGPTGSGKTTSLYAGLSHINNQEKNILTIEDPVEYQLDGIGQTQVNTKADMSFSRGLRAILRQDPDVVMIGEIRDKETADIAVQASLTGHLVLSTLHTNTAIGAVTRLADMGVEPFLVASSTIGIIAQRLVRVLCPHCKSPVIADEGEKTLIHSSNIHVRSGGDIQIFHANGCEECGQLGYIGRTGIYEIITLDDPLRTLIHNRASEDAMLTHVRQHTTSIREDGIMRVLEGVTTLDEVLRVTQES